MKLHVTTNRQAEGRRARDNVLGRERSFGVPSSRWFAVESEVGAQRKIHIFQTFLSGQQQAVSTSKNRAKHPMDK